MKVRFCPGSTTKQGGATFEMRRTRPEFRGRTLRGTMAWNGDAGICVDLRGSGASECENMAHLVWGELIRARREL